LTHYNVACRKLKTLVARRKRELAGGREWLDQPFSVLADEYMADIKARKKPRPASYTVPFSQLGQASPGYNDSCDTAIFSAPVYTSAPLRPCPGYPRFSVRALPRDVSPT
jgi:hypothetical protein